MNKVKVPIFIKLLLLSIGVTSIVSLYTNYKTSDFFKNSSLSREKEISFEKNRNTTLIINNTIKDIISKAKLYSAIIVNSGSSSKSDLMATLENDPDIEFLGINSRKESIANISKSSFLKRNKTTELELIDSLNSFNLPKKSVLQGSVQFKIINLNNNSPLFWIGIPLYSKSEQKVDKYITALIRHQAIQKFFKANELNDFYLVDKSFKIMAHSNEDKVLNEKVNYSYLKDIITSSYSNKQFIKSEHNENKLITFNKTLFESYIVSETKESSYLAPIEYNEQNSIFYLALILGFSLTIVAIYAQTITTPIEKLVEFTKQIAKGNFDLNINSNIKTSDEIGLLASAMDDMTIGLKEREKIKTVINKFHGETIADDIISGDIELKGEKKYVAVFFSDIRSFTKFSETRTAEEVVSMLNEYMDVMVKCIYKHGGVVDKFVGDAIMAVWGVPSSSESDIKNAVMACLDMRTELEILNKKRITRGEPSIMIGMGLHCGEVISGTVGSEDRMEYTVIGDTVNTAARIEASTKSFGTDFLISGEIKNKIKDDFLFSDAGAVKAKGKSNTLELFKVEGTNFNKQPKIIKTPYSHFEPEEESSEKTQRVS